MTNGKQQQLQPGVPCDHRGCLHHVTHPCEGCGRTKGKAQPSANLITSLDIECPACERDFDLLREDDDLIFSRAIFNNLWDDIKGVDITCPHCEAEFIMAGVDY